MRAALLAGAAVGILALGSLGCGSSGGEDESTTARAPNEFFGVVTQGPVTDRDLKRMQQGNVGTLRFMIPWGALDTTADRGPLDYSGIDELVLGAAERQIKLLPMLYGTPSWVAEDLDGERCDPNCAAYVPRSAKALEAWHEFVDELVERYGPGGKVWKEHPGTDPGPIRTWQIWNEQNSPTFYQPKVEPSSYNELLETSTDAIEAHDPNAEVILGGMFGTPFKGKPPAISAADYLRQLYAIDGADRALRRRRSPPLRRAPAEDRAAGRPAPRRDRARGRRRCALDHRGGGLVERGRDCPSPARSSAARRAMLSCCAKSSSS